MKLRIAAAAAILAFLGLAVQAQAQDRQGRYGSHSDRPQWGNQQQYRHDDRGGRYSGGGWNDHRGWSGGGQRWQDRDGWREHSWPRQHDHYYGYPQYYGYSHYYDYPRYYGYRHDYGYPRYYGYWSGYRYDDDDYDSDISLLISLPLYF